MRSAALAKNVQEIAKDLRGLKANADKLAAALEILKKTPNDAEACAVVERQMCFEDGNWGEGLTYLARGNDAALKNLATRELAQPVEPAARADLAGQWWSAAQLQTLTTRLRMQERTAKWYSAAEPKLLGIKREQASARIATAGNVLTEVVLMTIPIAADPAKAKRERDALRGGEQLPLAPVTDSLVIDGKKPYTLGGSPIGAPPVPAAKLVVPEKGNKVDITLGPGAEIRDGRIDLSGKGRLVLRGSAERPVILRNIEILGDMGASLDAEYAVLDQCVFRKTGGWFSDYSTKWSFKNSVLDKCRFPNLSKIDYGFRIIGCRLVGMTFPEITHKRGQGKQFNHLDHLRKDWNRIRDTEFADCAIPPTVAWCAENSNFVGCKFVPGAVFEGKEDFEWKAFVGDPVGETPRAVFDARPGTRGKVRVIAIEAVEVPHIGEKHIPEINYATRAVARTE